MDKVDKFAQWLNSHPDLSDITRFLVEYTFAEESANASRISVINDDRSLTFIGEYGHGEKLINKTVPADEWRQWRTKGPNAELGLDEAAWNSEHKTVASVLVDKLLVFGFIAVSFPEEIKNNHRIVATLLIIIDNNNIIRFPHNPKPLEI